MTNTTAPGTVAYASLLDRIVENGGYELPDGTGMWTIRSVHPDLCSSYDYRWPYPGNWAEAPGPIIETNADPCPAAVGDGLCVATTWEGMASGGIPALTLLLCAISTADALSPVDADKIRVRRAYVVDVIDGARAVREYGIDTDLGGADLGGANLRGADLGGANLCVANLCGANLNGANLHGAGLYRANLHGAGLRRADLGGANLRGANLCGANLSMADLSMADLCGANLRGADLGRANLAGADWDAATVWPHGFNPAEATK